MKKNYGNNAVYALLILAFFAFGCNLENTRAEENSGGVETEYKSEEIANSSENEAQTKSFSVAGIYEYDTETDGEGYDNSLEVKTGGEGKLYIFLSGSYIYKIGETQSMKEAEAKGDAVLQGNTGSATLVDEAGKPCRATIIFETGAADVKIPETCQFNIALGGVYKKVGPSSEEKAENTDENARLRETAYAKVMDFVNDFDSLEIGDEFIITDVPTAILNEKTRADEFGNKSYSGLFYLQGVTDDDSVSYSVLTSKKMIESLAQNAGSEPASLRMTAVSVESVGKFDVYRLPFITKIEALDQRGEVIWTADGGKPAKIKFTH